MAKGFGYPPAGKKKGGGAMGGINMDMIKQAQKMQQDMEKAMEELAAKTFTASAGGGVVTAEVSGERKMLALTIKPEAVDPDDVEMLQDMVIAAVNEALAQIDAETERVSKAASGGLKLPGF